jgi:hypothetical protein
MQVGVAGPGRDRGAPYRRLRWTGAAVVVWLLSLAVWWFTRSRGASLSGDEPHYLVLARMLAHGSLHPLAYYQQDARTHALFAWPANLLSNTADWHAYHGPHGLVTIHGLGLPLVLAPFVAVGGRSGAVAGLLAVEAALFVYLFARACAVAGRLRPGRGLGRPGRVVAAVVMAGPALWLAATQIYPDFLAGLLLAVAAVDLALAETTGRLDVPGVVIPGVSLGLVPWLHIKNLAPAVVILAALSVVCVRHRLVRRGLIMGGLVAASWLLLLVYDLYYFGHVLGEPQPRPTPSWAALTHGLGLIFDRHQGLVIQVPAVVVGVLGLWAARKIVPWAVAATVGAVGCSSTSTRPTWASRTAVPHWPAGSPGPTWHCSCPGFRPSWPGSTP